MEITSGKPADTAGVNQKTARLSWVDMARGFAVLLVMIGHSGAPKILVNWLYLFHIPLFFFLSGYVFKWEKHRDLKQFIRSRCYGLLIPSLTLGAITTLFNLMFSSIDVKTIWFRLLGALIQLRGGQFKMGLWFVTCLFVTELLFWCMMRFLKKPRRVIAALAVCSVVGYLYVQLIGKIVPWSLDVMCISVGFFGAGYFCANNYLAVFDKMSRISLAPLYFAVTASVLFINELLNQKIDMYMDKFGIYPLFYIGAFAGILMAVGVFKALPPLRPLVFLGRNTLAYYAIHIIYFRLFRMFLPFDNWAVDVSLAAILLAPTAVLLNKFLPVIVGKGKTRAR